ncbi:MAG: PEP-CTERM sorting domain-containing protein [Phycisphaerae bacterium]|nr:PEP-CTERM sorting domain-containing protein [Phycisphaerae bacterium]
MMCKRLLLVSVAACFLVSVPAAMAVPYASGLTQSGNTVGFVLNENATNVWVELDGGAATQSLGALAKGSHSFDMTGYSSYQIKVLGTAAAGWTQYSNDGDNTSKYYSPKGVTVDRNPLSPNFGRIYVSEGLAGTTAGRTTTAGIYVLDAAQGDVTGQGDAAHTGGVDWVVGGTNSPWKIGLNRTDPSDTNLYIADWSDKHSGVWTANTANFNAPFNELLDNTGRATSGIVLANQGAGPTELHGSVASGPWVEGSGADRKMYTIDEDVRLGNVLRYDIGTTTSGYATAPADQTVDGTGLGYIQNATADLVRGADGSSWIAQYRYTDSDAVPALSRWEDGASAPSWKSGPSTLPLNRGYGCLDILDQGNLIALGTNDGHIYILDISDPNNPVLADTIAHSGLTIRDVAFDVAGNLYVVSSSSETLRIYSPGGDWLAVTGSDGSFTIIPEPATLVLLTLGGFLLRRRVR